MEELQRQVALSALIVMAVMGLRWAIMRLIKTGVEGAPQRYRLRKLINYALLVITLVLVSAVWLEGLGGESLAAYLGLLSAGAAIALRDPLTNLVAWVYIVVLKPFRIGDRIEVDGMKGDIVDQNLFTFYMLELGNWVNADQSTGRVIAVPNALAFTRPVINYTMEFGYIWLEIPVVVTFESDWRAMRAVLENLGEKHTEAISERAEEQLRSASRLMISYGVLTPRVYLKAVDHGVELTLRCLVPARGRRGIQDAIWGEIMDALDANPELELAYPTQRFFDRRREQGPLEDAP